MRVFENGRYTPEYLAQKAALDVLMAERGDTEPFVVGEIYELVGGGKPVVCVEIKGDCARFSDSQVRWDEYSQSLTLSGWRYNRDGIDRGRCTGTNFDHSDPRCVIPRSKK